MASPSWRLLAGITSQDVIGVCRRQKGSHQRRSPLYVTQVVQPAGATQVSLIPKGPKCPVAPGPSPVMEPVSASSPAQPPVREALRIATRLFSASSQAPPTGVSGSGEPGRFFSSSGGMPSARQPWPEPERGFLLILA